jgi:hypothetical protein
MKNTKTTIAVILALGVALLAGVAYAAYTEGDFARPHDMNGGWEAGVQSTSTADPYEEGDFASARGAIMLRHDIDLDKVWVNPGSEDTCVYKEGDFAKARCISPPPPNGQFKCEYKEGDFAKARCLG